MLRFFNMPFLLVLIFITGINAQNQVELFKNELPDRVVNNTELADMVNINISHKAKVNPKLLYTYFNYLESVYNKKSSLDTKKLLDKERSMNSDFIEMKNEWIEKNISIIKDIDLEGRTRDRVLEYYYDQIKDVPKTEHIEAINSQNDQNIIDYLVFKYYSGNPELRYDSQTDYQVKRSEAEKRIMNKIEDFRNLNESEVSVNLDYYIEYLFDHWYLFAGVNNSPSTSSNVKSYDIILSLLDKSTNIANIDNFYFGAGFTFFNTSYKITENYYLIPLERNLDVEKSFNAMSFNANFGYLLQLKENFSYFTFLRFELAYMLGVQNQDLELDQGLNEHIDLGDYRITKEAEFTEDNIKINSYNSITFQITTPFFFIDDNFYLEAGVLAAYNTIDYQANYQYNYYRKEEQATLAGWHTEYLDQGVSGLISEDNSISKFVLLPSINVMYSFPELLYCKLNFAVKSATLQFGISF
ncbi:MAG: hypothetical protein K9J16_08015 [Melioribacteraceae bacterium]|nr:hypothetical protein [Melioribacteraceae bacterium]MCF8353847.1 hypothetical protein [Melioribacteraceae bacterium]MCF8393080.1 hypothetical protein [Melioribacteraceae bacterium]MCF8419199.1 hypothetical protein [Melioribacteraceae bacterium]